MRPAPESPQREPGGGEPPPAESDQPAESAEPRAAGEEHGEQGAVPPGAEALHVSARQPPRGSDRRCPAGRADR